MPFEISASSRIRFWTRRPSGRSFPRPRNAPPSKSVESLIAELQAADVVVLGVPMYNFGVPASLKNWIDAIARAGVTFRYSEKGPEGLLKGKKVYVALTRGGRYRNTPADTQVPYLKMVFGFLGLTDVAFVYAEGLNLGPDAEQMAINSAYQEIEDAVHPRTPPKAQIAERALA